MLHWDADLTDITSLTICFSGCFGEGNMEAEAFVFRGIHFPISELNIRRAIAGSMSEDHAEFVRRYLKAEAA